MTTKKLLVDLDGAGGYTYDVASEIADRILTEVGGRPAEGEEGVGVVVEVDEEIEQEVRSAISSILHSYKVRAKVRRIS